MVLRLGVETSQKFGMCNCITLKGLLHGILKCTYFYSIGILLPMQIISSVNMKSLFSNSLTFYPMYNYHQKVSMNVEEFHYHFFLYS